MLKPITVCAAFCSALLFSTATFAHSVGVIHSHDSLMFFDSNFWTLGIVALCAVSLTIARLVSKYK